MEWNAFVAWTDTIMFYPPTLGRRPDEAVRQDLIYNALGLSGEAGECLEIECMQKDAGPDRINLLMELGDCYYYLARCFTALKTAGVVGLPHQAPIDHSIYLPSMLLCNTVKKIARDGPTNELLQNARQILDRCFLGLGIMLNDAKAPDEEFTLPQLLDLVVKKLEDRKARHTLSGSGDNR